MSLTQKLHLVENTIKLAFCSYLQLHTALVKGVSVCAASGQLPSGHLNVTLRVTVSGRVWLPGTWQWEIIVCRSVHQVCTPSWS